VKRNIYIDFSYLIVLAATFGAVVVLGGVVAPVIFHTDTITVGILIDHYNAGIIMGEIFHRFSYWIYFLAVYVALYEAAAYKMGQRDAVLFGASVTVMFSSFMFSSIYVPKILSMQAAGSEATQSDTFENISVNKAKLGEKEVFLKEGVQYWLMIWEGEVITVKIPPKVNLVVTSAPDAVKGDTVSAATKIVETETGLKINVPLFIKGGDVISVNTDTLEYTGRVKE